MKTFSIAFLALVLCLGFCRAQSKDNEVEPLATTEATTPLVTRSDSESTDSTAACEACSSFDDQTSASKFDANVSSSWLTIMVEPLCTFLLFDELIRNVVAM